MTALPTGTIPDETSTTPEAAPSGRSPRRVAWAFGVAGAGALLSLSVLVVLAGLFIRLSWPHIEPLGNPEFGINFSCNQAEYLLLEDPALGPAGYVSDDRPGRAEWCAETLGTLLRGVGAKHLRISVEWSQVEPKPGQYDFRLVDALLARAHLSGAKVLLGVGVKAQRHPEFYIPDWVMAKANLTGDSEIDHDPYLREQALAMVAAVVAHVAGSPAIDAWSADNEPYVPSLRAQDWQLSREFVRLERDTIRANDPKARTISINHAQHFIFDRRWKDALVDSEALAASFYPFRNYEFLGRNYVIPIAELGPIAPNYAAQARAAHAAGKPFWLTEMQAEPWVDEDLRLVGPGNPSPNLTAKNFRKSIEYARRSGADRVYLWGAEWWLFQRQHYGDSTWWDLARAAITAQP
ncbi:MAG: beta-galactosidase [Anaerolineaceae bacterium]